MALQQLKYVLEFAPPMEGISGSFNTFRLGRGWAKRLVGIDRVFLMRKPECSIIGEARVMQVQVGRLREMATLCAHENHNQKGVPASEAAERLIEAMRRRYGPQKVSDTSFVTVIHLRV